ncbi:MAG: hypothetical protein SGI72_05545 [Planctomycetota bacterium]|nr:hypothetical protein [Planctomycetota bacterium]
MTQVPRDDRIFWIHRVLFGALVVVVFPVAYGLMVHPENTAENFAWPLAPRTSAMMFGSMYFSVVYLYTRVAFAKVWHNVALVLWATLPVLSALGVVTIRHWDKFTNDPVRLAVWHTAYRVFPPFLALILLMNRRHDPRVSDHGDIHIPSGLRRLSLVFGLVFAAVGAALLLWPVATAEVWPRPVEPLAAQALGCLFIAPAIVLWMYVHFERQRRPQARAVAA